MPSEKKQNFIVEGIPKIRLITFRVVSIIREFKQITTAGATGATTAAVTEKVWGEYVSVV